MEAAFYTKSDNKTVQCNLCPHNCMIAVGKHGTCRVRKNQDGVLISENYGKLCSFRFDPVEKKPLYHYYPGSQIFSIGSVGCNLKCKFCQNHEISQCSVDEYPFLKALTPQEIVGIVEKHGNNCGIAYTYNEPIVWYEYMMNIARLAQSMGIKNAVVTNGFINSEPLDELLSVIDAFSVDLKAFTEPFYKNLTSSALEPVKETLITISRKNKHLEITNLVITNQNNNEDDFSDMVQWISNELGVNTVLHISRYFPTYRLNEPSTDTDVLLRFHSIAKKYLNYVYLGNIFTENGSNTHCPKCGELLISRTGFSTTVEGLDDFGKCNVCGYDILDYYE
jgi:pyruvate formate lyase activating enzyme